MGLTKKERNVFSDVGCVKRWYVTACQMLLISVLRQLTCLVVARYVTEGRCQVRSRGHWVGWGLGLRWSSPGVLGSETGAFCHREFGTRTAH